MAYSTRDAVEAAPRLLLRRAFGTVVHLGRGAQAALRFTVGA